MPLLNDNELDRLSREAADQYDVEPSMSGWEGLEQRLDQELPQERRRRGLLFWWLLAGVLLLGGLLWGLRNWQGSGANEELTKKEIITDKDTRNNKEGNISAGTEDTKERSNRTETSISSTTISGTTEESKATGNSGSLTNLQDQQKNNSGQQPSGNAASVKPGSPSNISLNNDGQKNSSVKKSGKRSKLPPTDLVAEKPQNPNASTVNLPPTNTSNTPYRKTEQDLSEKIETVTSSNPAQSSSVPSSPDVPGKKQTPQTSITDSTNQPATATSAQTTTIRTKPLNLSSRKGSIYIAALAGLDLSNVKFSNAGKTGFNGGLQLGYYFTDRLSINTGLIYNRKNYKARGKDFTPKGPMVYYDIDKIDGWCAMFDIPLNVRYDLGIKPRSRYFISAGVSSYLMDKEDYDYYYYNNSGNYSERNWKTNENTNYFFSILNFSAGAEKQLGQHLQLQVEPYLKMPVKGIGHGEIQLNSFGINLGLKYQFGKSGKK